MKLTKFKQANTKVQKFEFRNYVTFMIYFISKFIKGGVEKQHYNSRLTAIFPGQPDCGNSKYLHKVYMTNFFCAIILNLL